MRLAAPGSGIEKAVEIDDFNGFRVV